LAKKIKKSSKKLSKDKKAKPVNAESIFIGMNANDDRKIPLEELKKGVNWKKINQSK
jgi:hypothetical protein